jgi:biotin-(acetyl-CoA carboxylase) ligase
LTAEPTFPPLLNGIPVEPEADPCDVACRAAAEGSAGAGDVYWSRSETRLALALIVEPELPSAQALDMLFVAMVAFGDSIGAIAPPEVGVGYVWPQALLVNGARVGSVSLRLAPGSTPGEAPDWMVVEVNARIAAEEGMPEPGLYIDRTTLWDEGCGPLTRTEVLESFVRHLKTWIHDWETDGPRSVREAWLARAPKPGEAVTWTVDGESCSGTFLGLDENGNMLAKAGDSTLVADLPAALQPNPYVEQAR